MNMRIYASGLSRIRADPMIGRFFMLEHQHDWGFDPSRKMTIGTGDPIFRELRQKYRYSRDEERVFIFRKFCMLSILPRNL